VTSTGVRMCGVSRRISANDVHRGRGSCDRWSPGQQRQIAAGLGGRCAPVTPRRPHRPGAGSRPRCRAPGPCVRARDPDRGGHGVAQGGGVVVRAGLIHPPRHPARVNTRAVVITHSMASM
jgi:hypothetical protein